MAMCTEEWIEADCLPYYPHPIQTGLPAGYYPPQTEQGAQLPAITQSFPSEQWATFAQQQQQPFHQASDAPRSHRHQYHAQTLMSPSVSSCGEAASTHGSPWSSPNHETEFDAYSHHGSPLSAGVPAAYNQEPVSPAAWSASSPMHLPFRPVDEQQSPEFQQARMCSPVSNGSPHMAQQSFYQHTSHPIYTPAHSPLMGMPPATMPTTTSVPAQLFPPSPEGNSEVDGPLDDDDVPGHEPYSKQIGRALLNLPGRAGNVQQIYDWFEANTNRSERVGWKNSVRHNLSLNEAFNQIPDPNGKDAQREGEDRPRGRGASTKGNNWVLLKSSVAEIESTAKFRTKNKGGTRPRAQTNRVVKRSSPPQNGGRTLSGRRGGRATSMMKQRRQSYQSTAAGRGESSATQTQWMMSTPEANAPPTPAHTPEANAPPTPAQMPEESGLAGAGMVDARFRVDLSGYQLGDVAGVWNGGGLFTGGGFGGMPEQPQWHPGNSGGR